MNCRTALLLPFVALLLIAIAATATNPVRLVYVEKDGSLHVDPAGEATLADKKNEIRLVAHMGNQGCRKSTMANLQQRDLRSRNALQDVSLFPVGDKQVDTTLDMWMAPGCFESGSQPHADVCILDVQGNDGIDRPVGIQRLQMMAASISSTLVFSHHRRFDSSLITELSRISTGIQEFSPDLANAMSKPELIVVLHDSAGLPPGKTPNDMLEDWLRPREGQDVYAEDRKQVAAFFPRRSVVLISTATDAERTFLSQMNDNLDLPPGWQSPEPTPYVSSMREALQLINEKTANCPKLLGTDELTGVGLAAVLPAMTSHLSGKTSFEGFRKSYLRHKLGSTAQQLSTASSDALSQVQKHIPMAQSSLTESTTYILDNAHSKFLGQCAAYGIAIECADGICSNLCAEVWHPFLDKLRKEVAALTTLQQALIASNSSRYTQATHLAPRRVLKREHLITNDAVDQHLFVRPAVCGGYCDCGVSCANNQLSVSFYADNVLPSEEHVRMVTIYWGGITWGAPHQWESPVGQNRHGHHFEGMTCKKKANAHSVDSSYEVEHQPEQTHAKHKITVAKKNCGWCHSDCSETGEENWLRFGGLWVQALVRDCQDGWSGDDCTIPSCANVSDCSGRGVCIGVNSCVCPPGYSGPACDTPDSLA